MDAGGTPAGCSNAAAGPNAVEDLRASNLRRYQPLVVITLALAAGIAWDRYGPRSLFGNGADSARDANWFGLWWSSCACCLVLWCLAWSWRLDRAAGWILLATAALAGSAWHELNWFLFDRDEIGRYANFEPAPVCIDAVACEAPERVTAPSQTPLRAIPAGERSRLLLEVMRIRDGSVWRPASGTCQLSVEGHLLGVHQGDRLRVFGQFARIAPPLNPGEFDFAARARADGHLVRIRSSRPECVTTLDEGGIWSFAHLLGSVRQRAQERVRSLIGTQHAGLAAAILLGAREGLPQEETEAYMLTGTIHVLVVSGLHVGILAMGLWGLIRMGWLSRRAGLCLIMAVVVAYALLAEVHPSVVRAATLCVLICLAAWFGRRGVAFNSLFAAALVVLAMNPNELFQAGPQLSFLAVATLIWAGRAPLLPRIDKPDRLDEMLAAVRPWYRRALAKATRWTAGLLITSGAVWLATLPLVSNRFHVAAPVAVVITPVIWLFVCAAMWSGFTMLVAGWLIPPLGAACAAACNLSLTGLESIVRRAESIPLGHVWLAGPTWWWVLVFYLGFIVVMIWGRSLLAPRWQLATLAIWIIVGLIPLMTRGWMRRVLECTAVAVGHGECVFLQAPGGETMLYDAGGIGAPEYATQAISSFLWDRGINRIDGIVLSHSDLDHYNAVPGLLERFHVGAIFVSTVMFNSNGNAADRGPAFLKSAIERAGVPIREIWSGNKLHVGPEVTIQVMHPPRKGVIGSDNANSVTLGVEYAGRRVLLPGDLESPGLDDVMAELPYDCDVLLAPHHGSRRSDPPGFSAWSTPEWVVLSGGGGEQAAPVIRTYEQAGARVFVTNEVGAVHFSVLPDSTLTMTTWRKHSQRATSSGNRP